MRKLKLEHFIAAISVIVTVVLAFVIIKNVSLIRHMGAYGYGGAFVISVLSGGTVVVPIPGLAVIFSLGGVLNPLWLGLVAGLGEAIGAVAIYFTGAGGRTLIERRFPRAYPRIVGWVQRKGDAAVFLYSAVFNPFYYPLTLACGALRFGWLRFFLLSWAGKTIKGLSVAYAGYFGLRWLLHLT